MRAGVVLTQTGHPGFQCLLCRLLNLMAPGALLKGLLIEHAYGRLEIALSNAQHQRCIGATFSRHGARLHGDRPLSPRAGCTEAVPAPLAAITEVDQWGCGDGQVSSRDLPFPQNANGSPARCLARSPEDPGLS